MVAKVDRAEHINETVRCVLFVGSAGGIAAGIAWCGDRPLARAVSRDGAWLVRIGVLAAAMLIFVAWGLVLDNGPTIGGWFFIAGILVALGTIAGLVVGLDLLGFLARSPYAFWLAPTAGLCVLALSVAMPQTAKPYEGKSIRYWQNELSSAIPARQARGAWKFSPRCWTTAIGIPLLGRTFAELARTTAAGAAQSVLLRP